MITRRHLLQSVAVASTMAIVPQWLRALQGHTPLDALLDVGSREHWSSMAIGDRIGKIGKLFLGSPYTAGSLEGEGPEVCRIIFSGFDCVTFFENVLGVARLIERQGTTMDELMQEVTYTRYRSGKLDGYVSRLHYTSDWIQDNIKKGVVIDVTKGANEAKRFPVNVNFMSKHPEYYAPLKDSPVLVKEIAKIEKRINKVPRWYVPKENIASFEQQLQTGDIVAITTSKKGLDYAHTGIIFVDETGKRRLMHASSSKNQVVLDVPVSEYVNSVSSHTGITVVRPLPRTPR